MVFCRKPFFERRVSFTPAWWGWRLGLEAGGMVYVDGGGREDGCGNKSNEYDLGRWRWRSEREMTSVSCEEKREKGWNEHPVIGPVRRYYDAYGG